MQPPDLPAPARVSPLAQADALATTSPADSAHVGQHARRARSFVVVMGIVALFGDMTYEGARGLVGPYLGLLGASATAIGFAAGLGEFVGYAVRLVTGWVADRTRAYWPLVIAGYALNVVAVPGLAFTGRWEAAIALLLLERLGKAVRSPARSTLVSYAANEAGVGFSFGLEEALDQIGAVSGPLLTALAIWLGRGETPVRRYQWAFLVLLAPALANLGCVLLARRRYPRPESFESKPRASAPAMSGLLGWYILATALLGFGFADWALVAFHASKTGLIDVAWLPVLYAAVMGVDALAALVFGSLFDRMGIRVLAVSAVISAAFAPLVFLAPMGWVLVAGSAAWAVGMGAQESTFKAVIADLVPKEQRSRAYGVFFAFFGLAWWLGSTLMGWLYAQSPRALAIVSAATQLAAVPIVLALAPKIEHRRRS